MLLKRDIPIWFIAKKVRHEALYLAAGTIAIYMLRVVFREWHRPHIPLSLVTVLGTAISLVLAFRINQSYDRWWEARVVWGAIVNDSRTLVRQLLAFTTGGREYEVRELTRRIALRQIAWCYCLGQSLRNQDPMKGLKDLLSKEDYERMARADNKPNMLLLRHSADITDLSRMEAVSAFDAVQLDNTVTRLCDHIGKCERIKSTIFPRTYSLFIHSFIYLFVFCIPFGLGQAFGISEIPLTTGIGIAFFLIEKTAVHLQDPFENRPTDTAMTTIATNIHRNIMHMLDEGDKAPEPYPAGPFYAM